MRSQARARRFRRTTTGCQRKCRGNRRQGEKPDQPTPRPADATHDAARQQRQRPGVVQSVPLILISGLRSGPFWRPQWVGMIPFAWSRPSA